MKKFSLNKQFGILIFVILITSSIFIYTHSFITSIFLIILSLFILIITLKYSSKLTLFTKIWIRIGETLGKIVSPFVLAILYLFAITPIAFITRLSGRDVLKIKKNVYSSYWIDKETISQDSLKNQY